MTDHEPMPALCPDCRRTFEERIEREATAAVRPKLAWCEHNRTLAACEVEHGRARWWQLQTARTRAEANELIDQLSDAILLGLTVKSARPQ